MKRKIVVSLALMLAGLTGAATDNATAGAPQWIAGLIFEENTTSAVPFASLCLYDDATGELEYSYFTATDGIYSLPEVETDKVYRLTVSAPGYLTLEKKIKPQAVDIEGNVWYPLAVTRSSDATDACLPMYKWTPEELGIDAKNVETVYTAVPCIDFEDGFASDKNGGSVIILFNWNVISADMYQDWVEYYKQHPVGGIEYYDLGDDGLYSGVLNIYAADSHKPSAEYPAENCAVNTAWDME